VQVEQGIQRAILEYLNWKHIYCWKSSNGSFHHSYFRKGDKTWQQSFVKSGLPGSSDILGVLPGGRFLAIEVKSPTGRVSPHQQQFIDTINAAGGLAFVARSIEEVQKNIPV
jgi:hypothetical protein